MQNDKPRAEISESDAAAYEKAEIQEAVFRDPKFQKIAAKFFNQEAAARRIRRESRAEESEG